MAVEWMIGSNITDSVVQKGKMPLGISFFAQS